VPLKRPVTLPQARRWPAAAKRRESFCARMGGMRDTLTGEDAATDPDSPINRALAAWDCDKPEGLKRQHVSKGIRPMKITQSKVGAEARKPARKTAARKNPARKTAAKPAAKTARKTAAKLYAVHKVGMKAPIAVFSARSDAIEFGQSWANIHKTPVQVSEQ
jgi:hypothetical protein